MNQRKYYFLAPKPFTNSLDAEMHIVNQPCKITLKSKEVSERASYLMAAKKKGGNVLGRCIGLFHKEVGREMGNGKAIWTLMGFEVMH